jgi:hypothetical protein
MPSWLPSLGSWAHSANPQNWDEKGKEVVKEILTKLGPIVLKSLGVPPGVADIVTGIVQGKKPRKALPTKEACKELKVEAKREKWRKKYYKKKEKKKEPTVLKLLNEYYKK